MLDAIGERQDVFLSTPSARRATGELLHSAGRHVISIHALREEGDQGQGQRQHDPPISIHALREEGDGCSTTTTPSQTYFYPRPPRGGRPNGNTIYDGVEVFLSTPSARRATAQAEREFALWSEFLSTPSARRATNASLQRLEC